MSNLTHIKTRIKNRDHLLEALKQLNFTVNLSPNQKVSNYYHSQSDEFTATNKHGAQFRFLQDTNKGYTIIASTATGISVNALETEVQRIENRIKREYARSLVLKNLQGHGFTLESENQQDESIVIRLSRIV